MESLITAPRGWIESFGEIVKFCSRIVYEVLTGRPLKFFGETLRQAGILIVGSTLVIWGLVFITGLTCGLEGGDFPNQQGTSAYAGGLAAWAGLLELVPYAFRSLAAAKIG